MKYKKFSNALILSLVLSMLMSVIPAASASENIINIENSDDFIEFAHSCTLDTWSQNKTVNLNCDIDFSDIDFSPVPTFGGSFNGNGHTVSGIVFEGKGSYQGLFRYVQQSGKISDLSVSGTFSPGGSKSFIGGIAGENSGSIEKCSFYGNIKGENVIGGISGNNTESGRVISCSSYGSITGENSTGGITGKNSGLVQNCTNNSAVNTVYEEKKNEISDIDADTGALIENYKMTEEETEEESVLGHTDTGGITGLTSGIVQGCINNGAVGYQHVGYNVGGIAGRQSGYMLGCRNYGFIQGRKDVGGITGQAEPYILLDTSEINFQNLQNELDNLNNMVNNFISYTDELGSDTEKYLNGITEQTKNARDNAQIIIDQGAEILDDNISEINAGSAVLSDTLNKIIPVFDTLKSIGENSSNALSNADDALKNTNIYSDELTGKIKTFNKSFENMVNELDELITSLDDIKLYAPELSDAIDNIRISASNMRNAIYNIGKALSRVQGALEDLNNAVTFNNSQDVRAAATLLSDAIEAIITAKRDISDSLDSIEGILQSIPDDLENIGINSQLIIDNIKAVKDNIVTSISSLRTIKDSLGTIIVNAEIDFSEIRSAAKNIAASLRNLEDANGAISNSLYELSTAFEYLGGYISDTSDDIESVKDDLENSKQNIDDSVDDLKNSADDLHEEAENISSGLKNAKNSLSDAIKSLSYTVDDIQTAVETIKNATSELSNDSPLKFVKPSDELKAASDNLFDSLSGISNEIDGLKSTVSNEKNKISEELRSITNQFDVVINLLIDSVNDIQSVNSGLDNIFLDVSDEDIENSKQGKIADCQNYGDVSADKNTGGIAGAMAIEYSKDPEDDIEKPDTLNFTYQTKAILHGCINDGNITGKKDCIGGIVGLSEIGTVYECENYGSTESSDGNYVGGISGSSESSVRKSCSKSKVSGKRYIGGIAGKSNVISSCYTIVNISGEENTGAVCGETSDIEKLSGNFFVDNGLGAVDGISYSSKAEEINFDELKNVSGIPLRFISFTVTFIADGNIVETESITYGSKTSEIIYPEIPVKDGFFGNWRSPESDTVTENLEIVCDYQPYITILSSVQNNESGKLALALAEGNFTDKSELNITDSHHNPPENASGNIKIYDVSISNTDIKKDDVVTIRILNENKDKVSAWILQDNNWQKSEVKYKGKYILLQTSGTQNTICLKFEENRSPLIYIITAVPAVIIISFILLLRKKRKLK